MCYKGMCISSICDMLQQPLQYAYLLPHCAIVCYCSGQHECMHVLMSHTHVCSLGCSILHSSIMVCGILVLFQECCGMLT